MKRNELLRNREWWIANIQNDLYALIYEYMKKNKLNKNGVAETLKFSKSYLSQLLNGNFDHKISKLVDVSLSLNKVPIIHYVDLDQYIKDDALNKTYQLYPVLNPGNITFELAQSPTSYSPIQYILPTDFVQQTPSGSWQMTM